MKLALLILLILLTLACHAQSLQISQATLIGSQAADSWTTMHASEANPLGKSGVVALKVASTGALLLIEHYATRHHPERRKWFTILNVGLSAEFGWAAWHNERLRT